MNNTTIEHAIDQLKNLFQEDLVFQLAHQSRLIQRSSSKLNPMALLMVMVIDMSLIGTLSLVGMCDAFIIYGGIRMTAQGLSLRLGHESTVRFFKFAYSRVIQNKLSRVSFQLKQEGILARFKNVYLEDSTSCVLHEKVADSFKGSGGSSSKAGYKIHTIWNATKNSVERLLITSSNTTDQSQVFDIIPRLVDEDLVLRDLGYFSLAGFRQIIEAKAFFLSRLKSGIKVYTLDGMLIEDLARYVDERIFDNSATMELEVFLSAKEKLRVRLVACKVPQSVYDQRVRKLRRKTQKNKRTLSKATLSFNRYTFFVTNIPEELLAATEMVTLYKLRWEIELLFKVFKSNLQVDIIKGQSKNRVDCFIISKLIAIMATAILFAHLSTAVAILHGRELSFAKFVTWIITHGYLAILFRPEVLNYEVMQMKNMDILALCKQKRSRRTSRELLEAGATYTELYPQTSGLQPLTPLA